MSVTSRNLLKLAFSVVFLLLCWMSVQIVHEFGHVCAALAGGGKVSRVVLDPRTISRTDFSANPQPHLTVWGGPLGGAGLPVVFWLLIASGQNRRLVVLPFFAGFALVVNGAYLVFGAADGVGDCGVMQQCGTPVSVMVSIGGALLVAGFWLWHRLGSPAMLLHSSELPKVRDVAAAAVAMMLLACCCAALFPDV